jgi:hypothetical protein
MGLYGNRQSPHIDEDDWKYPNQRSLRHGLTVDKTFAAAYGGHIRTECFAFTGLSVRRADAVICTSVRWEDLTNLARREVTPCQGGRVQTHPNLQQGGEMGQPDRLEKHFTISLLHPTFPLIYPPGT